MIKHFSARIGSSFVLFSIIVIAGGCTKGHFSSYFNSKKQEPSIISNRPQMRDKVIVLLKFKNPPLLTTVQVVDGKKQIDESLKKAILEEQAEVEKSLKKLSEDIYVLYRYKMVMNGFAVVAPISVLNQLKVMGGVAYVENEGSFSRPAIMNTPAALTPENIQEENPVKFIGAHIAHKIKVKGKDGQDVPLDGTGIKVGIIDTGIDFTHAMFGGAGTEEAYKGVDPNKETTVFPNAKVVGGIDLAGTTYDSVSANLQARLPIPDANPIDEGGHGTHVAGTVAGKGDGVNTFDGVAPGAQLYAIKVFGAKGSTGDATVIAGLEYAADPTGEGDPSRQLDVVNMSLGGPYGSPHVLYQEAIANLTKGGTAVIASAGNSGQLDYIVGAPSVSDDALSVAASIDFSQQNWRFPALKFIFSSGDLLAEGIESPISKPLAEVGDLNGPLVYIGTANQELDEATKAKLKGKVALIDRGLVAFAEKIGRAQDAGAVGVVVANNQPGEPMSMGGEGSFTIPAVMVSQSVGDSVKAKMKDGEVVIRFNNPEKIEKKELIDTITGFSSKGPRSHDSVIKPEISSPGQNVISAAMGKGRLGIQMSGTSMAAPNMAGATTLLKQLRPNLTVAELKSLAMQTAKFISDAKGQEYPVSVQGAGRIQVDKAILAESVVVPSSVSLGEQNLSKRKVIDAKLLVKNFSKEKTVYKPQFRAKAKGISMVPMNPFSVAAGESVVLTLRFVLEAQAANSPNVELDGFVTLANGGPVDLTIPVLAVVKHISNIKVKELAVQSSEEDSAGAVAEMKLKNEGANAGEALVFNLLGVKGRKSNPDHSPYVDVSCNLQAAGYRLIKKDPDGNGSRLFLQFAAKLYQPEDTWNTCEISVLIDKEGKGIPSQELAGIALGNVPGIAGPKTTNQFSSVLFDAVKVRDLRRQFEVDAQIVGEGIKSPTENYQPAVLAINGMRAINHTTIAIIEVEASQLHSTVTGEISVRMATISSNAGYDTDDYLQGSPTEWTRISLQESSQSFFNMPESIVLKAGEEKSVSLSKGYGHQKVIALFPDNANVRSDLVRDGQSQVLRPTFGN